jgi:hypothetical protein
LGTLLDTAIIATVVSAAVTALGWFASHWSTQRIEARRRLERIIDVQWALLAEIESNLIRYAETDLDAHERDMLLRIRRGKGRNGFTPFVPRYVTEVVFEAFVPDIHILPTETIRDVVAYYKQEYKLRELVEDLRSDRFRALPADRKANLYSHYIWQIKSVLAWGEQARAALVNQLGPEARRNAINSRAAAPSPASET